MTRCLILSMGPVPTPEHEIVEGGGLRCWGLARGIKANAPEIDVVVAHNDVYGGTDSTDQLADGIALTTWSLPTIPNIIAAFDSVIVSYCMADLSVQVVRTMPDDKQLVLDCYVPIYVEISARNTLDLEQEQLSFDEDLQRWTEVLRRGDMFLCASESQRAFYEGVLSGVGRINPTNYGQELILKVPFGIHRDRPIPRSKPLSGVAGKLGIRHVLWFGGLYPWFKIHDLIDAIAKVNEQFPCRLVVVGAKNPFNEHPDFVRAYAEARRYATAQDVQGLVTFHDWVKYGDRADWYLDSDLAVLINRPGAENKLAWRTRLADFMWADLPVLTNGGDTLGELLLDEGAAFRLHSLDSAAIAEAIIAALKDQEATDRVRRRVGEVKRRFFWDVVTSQLARDIVQLRRAPDLEMRRELALRSVIQSPAAQISTRSEHLPRLAHMGRRVARLARHARQHGLRSAGSLTWKRLRTAVVARVSNGRKRR